MNNEESRRRRPIQNQQILNAAATPTRSSRPLSAVIDGGEGGGCMGYLPALACEVPGAGNYSDDSPGSCTASTDDNPAAPSSDSRQHGHIVCNSAYAIGYV